MNYVKDVPIQPDRGSAIGRVLLGGEVVHIPDVDADPDYIFPKGENSATSEASLAFRCCAKVYRSASSYCVAPKRGPSPTNRSNWRPTFADQAAIAIENVRLFDEVQAKTRDLSEALDYQTGSGTF